MRFSTKRWKLCLLGLIVLVMGTVLVPVHAADGEKRSDAQSAEEDSKAKPETSKDKSSQADGSETDAAEAQSKANKNDKKKGKDYFKGLDQFDKRAQGKNKLQKSSGEDPLERAIGNMRQAEERISQEDTGQETRELQQQVVSDLQKLIDLAQQQPPAANQPPPQDSPQQQEQQQKQKQKQQGGAQSQQEQQGQKQQQAQSKAGQKGQGEENEDARESTERNGSRKQTTEELSRRDQLVKDVWGHLPPTLRQELRNIYSEQYLPKYEDVVRRYYEALAEQGRKEDE